MYRVDTFKTGKTFDNIKDATQYFNKLIEFGVTYVELKEVVSDFPNYYAKSVRIFYQ